MPNLWPPDVFFSSRKCTKTVFGLGSAQDPAGGAHDAPLDPLVCWGGGHPLSIPLPLDAFRRLDLDRRLRRLASGPSNTNGYAPASA